MTVIRTGIPQYMANLEAQRDVAIARAEAAEKKVAELEEVLRELLDDCYLDDGEIVEKCYGVLNK